MCPWSGFPWRHSRAKLLPSPSASPSAALPCAPLARRSVDRFAADRATLGTARIVVLARPSFCLAGIDDARPHTHDCAVSRVGRRKHSVRTSVSGRASPRPWAKGEVLAAPVRPVRRTDPRRPRWLLRDTPCLSQMCAPARPAEALLRRQTLGALSVGSQRPSSATGGQVPCGCRLGGHGAAPTLAREVRSKLQHRLASPRGEVVPQWGFF